MFKLLILICLFLLIVYCVIVFFVLNVVMNLTTFTVQRYEKNPRTQVFF